MTRLTPKDSLSPLIYARSLSPSLPSVFLHKYSILTGYRHLRTRNIKHAFRGLGQEASPVKQKCRRWVILHLQKSSFKSPALPKLAPPGGMQETLKKKNEKCGSARASLYAQFTQRGSAKGAAADSSPNSANKFEKNRVWISFRLNMGTSVVCPRQGADRSHRTKRGEKSGTRIQGTRVTFTPCLDVTSGARVQGLLKSVEQSRLLDRLRSWLHSRRLHGTPRIPPRVAMA